MVSIILDTALYPGPVQCLLRYLRCCYVAGSVLSMPSQSVLAETLAIIEGSMVGLP